MNRSIIFRGAGAAVFVATLVAIGGCAAAGGGGLSIALIGTALSVLLGLAGCTTSHGPGGVDADGDGYDADIDCDDDDATVHPDATEMCESGCMSYGDGLDNDCDGAIDESRDCEIVSNCFPQDFDGDGYFASEDCDDADPTVHPGADEMCGTGCESWGDGVDNDCDGAIDEPDACVIVNCFPEDLDGDGWSAPDDCDDSDPDVHPDAAELCCDMVDSNCDGYDAPEMTACNCFYDADGDGYGDGFGPGPDCNDADPTIHPGAEETACDMVDSNCDGMDDPEGFTGICD